MANAYTASTDQNTLPNYYSKVFLERLVVGPKAMQFCMKKPLPKGSGTAAYFPRIVNPSDTVSAYKLTEGTIISTEKVVDVQVSALIEQFGNAQAVTDITNLTAINGMVEEATRALADQADAILDQRILQEAYGTSATPTGQGFSAFAYNTVGGTDLGTSTSAFGTYVGNTEFRMTAATLRAATGKLRARNVKPFEDGYFGLLVHSDTASRLRDDSEWQSAYQYTDPKSIRMGITSAYEGVKVVVDNNVTTSANGSGGNTLYYSVLLGQGAMGATELDGGISFYATNEGASKADPINQFTSIGWKSNFVPKILNVSCGLNVITADA
jgi:N4-gp56 family major capsid protein